MPRPEKLTRPAGIAGNSGNDARGTPALVVALLGFFVITLDALALTLALPAIAQDLGGGLVDLQWVVESYTLAFAALLLLAGSMSDRFGARRAFAAGLVVFVTTSLACALATNLEGLIAARAAQGIGAALMTPASLSLIREGYHDSEERARAIGTWAVGAAVAAAAGPTVGGALSLVDWRLIFFINVPIGLAALLVLRRVPTSSTRPSPLDWRGQLTSILALGCLAWAVIEGGSIGYDDPAVLASLAIGLMSLATFVRIQGHSPHPMVPPALVSSRPIALALAVAFCFVAAFYGMVFLLSLYLQQQRGLTSLEAGLTFLPMTIGAAFMNVASGRATARFGAHVPITVGLALMAIGLVALGTSVTQAPALVLAILMAPVGLGGALATPAATAVVLDHAPVELVGIASGVLNASRQVGGALAIAAFGALVATLGMEDGIRVSFAGAAGLIALVVMLCLISRGQLSARGRS